MWLAKTVVVFYLTSTAHDHEDIKLDYFTLSLVERLWVQRFARPRTQALTFARPPWVREVALCAGN
jgi:hypothetical protein